MQHGIEQELQIVSLETKKLCSGRIQELVERVRPRAEDLNVFADFDRDFYDTQLEYRIGIFSSAFELGEKLAIFRREVTKQAEQLDLGILACGTNPLCRANKGENFGEHHHIGVPSSRNALLLHDLLRLFIPELISFSANSPFYGGSPQPYQSFRLNRSPHSSCPPHLDSEDEMKIRWISHSPLGVGERMWDVTPFTKRGLCTVEVRLFDVQPRITRSVAIAGLLQALAKKIEGGTLDNQEMLLSDKWAWNDGLNLNRESAIRDGIGASFELHDRPVLPLGNEVRAEDALSSLIEWLDDELEAQGDDGEAALTDVVSSELSLCREQYETRQNIKADEYAAWIYAATREGA